MKKILLIGSLIFSGIYFNELMAQSFQTGSIGVEVNVYGRVRIHAPQISNLRQIDRSSILIGVNKDQVFDYKKDADTEIQPYNVQNPQKSDYEIFGAFNNAYSNLPPNFLVRLSVYGWQNQSYILCKFTVVNRETNALNSYIGIEFIPQPDGTYGLETVKFNLPNYIGYSYRDASPVVGYKIFSQPTYSFRIIDWTASYYDPDSLLWGYLTYGNFDTSFVAGGDGSVAILTQQPVTIQPNDSVHFWVGIAVGANETQLINNMEQAYAKYSTLTSVEDEVKPSSYQLKQNYPNPFNPKTIIEFLIPEKQKIDLSVYNALGQKIKTLVNQELEAGKHFIEFDGSDLNTGIYFYELRADQFKSTKKMVLIK